MAGAQGAVRIIRTHENDLLFPAVSIEKDKTDKWDRNSQADMKYEMLLTIMRIISKVDLKRDRESLFSHPRDGGFVHRVSL